MQPQQIISLAIAALLVPLAVSGCGKSPQEAKLIGTWGDPKDKDNAITFLADGSCKMKMKKSQIDGDGPKRSELEKKLLEAEYLNGKWQLLKDGRIKMDMTLLGTTTSAVCKLEFDGEEMILTDEYGTPSRYKRLQ